MESEVRQALDEILDRRLIARIWAKDHTVWKPQPEEIVNRLGWLTVPVVSEQQVPQLRELAVASRSRGIRDVVLLGMGGSSLAPEVLRLTFGARRGWPRLHVLDFNRPRLGGTRGRRGRPPLHAVPGIQQVRRDDRSHLVLPLLL